MTNREDIAAMRRQYGEVGLVEANLPADPITLFDAWLKDAASNEIVFQITTLEKLVRLKKVRMFHFSFLGIHLSDR